MAATPPIQPRYIIARAFNADEYDNASFVLMQVVPSDLELAQKAMLVAAKFDVDMQDFYGNSTLTTGSLGGEFVFTSMPSDLDEWLAERDDLSCDEARLLPRSIEPLIEKAIEEWREGDVRWASSNLRLKCSKEEIHAEVEAKSACDLYVWTRDLAQVFAALKQDFEIEEFVTDPNHGR